MKGIGGIVYVHQPFEDTWIGDRSRIEFRTPCFVNLRQQALALDALYYLSWCHASHSAAGETIMNRFAEQFDAYLKSKSVPLMWPANASPDKPQHFSFGAKLTAPVFETYLQPYAELLRHPDGKVKEIVRTAVLNARDEAGMQKIPTIFENGRIVR